MKQLILIVLAVAACVSVLVWTRPESIVALQEIPRTRVVTTQVQRMDIQPVNRVTGKLRPSRKADLRFELSGTLVSREIEPGQKVVAGQRLLGIDDGDLRDAVIRARADLAREQAAVQRDRKLLALVVQERKLQQRELDRLSHLENRHLTSQSRYDQAKQELLRQRAEEARLRYGVETAASRLRARKSALATAERNLQRVWLKAPFDATVNSVSVEVGDYVSPGQRVVELVKLDVLDLHVEVPGSVAGALALGQQVKVTREGRVHEGVIVALASDPDPSTHTHAVRVRADAQGMRPGQLAHVALPGRPLVDVTVAPLSAILHEDGRAYVFRLRDGRVSRVPVTVHQRYRDLQVIAGVGADDTIVARDVAVLADGQEVTVAR